MNCPACGRENREGAGFCRDCGASLRAPAACPQCNAEVEADQKFCDVCGATLPGTAAAAPPAPAAASTPPAAAPSMPTSVAGGRYEVERFLGEGVRKQVYLAHDTRLDRDVALAVIKTEGFDDNARQRVQREAQAMGRLGDHPHIVTVHDIGEDGDQLYIVSEYMAGGDLAGVLADAADGRLCIEDALRMGGQVCGALEHAHARDIIHRDLKPGNVWLRGDADAQSAERGAGSGGYKNQALLGDFGLAVDLERSRITQEGTMLGTVAYMPPEQALGRPADARSDLYAFGAMLYEMVTGRTPFQGDDAVAIITQHINTPPVHPSWHSSQVPQSLDALIMQLLAKAPDDRPASAAEVGTRLQQIAAESGETALSVSMQAPAAGVGAGRIAWGQFVGRVEELGGLKAGVDEALSGKGNLRLLVGEPGIGKTRTAEELATYAKLRGAQVLIGRCYEGDGAPPYWPWVQIVRAYVQEQPPAQLRSDMGPGAADIAQVVSDVGAALPDLEPPPTLDPEQAQFRLFDSVTTFLKNVSVNRPLVLILDDLHWADKPSLLLLQFLVRELGGTRIAILGTYRDVELDRTHPLADVLSELRRARLYQRVLLRGLGVDEVFRMLEALAGQTLPEQAETLAAAIHRETEGNPFFVEEIILHLAETEAIYRDEDGQWVTRTQNPEELGIPEGVREVVGRRLSRLSDACNAVLGIGAVIGRDFDVQVVERISDLDNHALWRALEEAAGAGLVTEQAGGRHRFSHALIRETLYDELSTPRRVQLHWAAGEALEAVHAHSIDAHLPELAHHFFEGVQGGGDVAKAVDYCTRAAERARAQVAHAEAVLQYERALQALEFAEDADQSQRCELLLALSEARFNAGGRDGAGAREAGGQAAEVARRLSRPDLLARAALAHATDTWTPGVVEDPVVTLLEEALAALDPGDSVLRVRLLGQLSRELLFGSDDERRIELADEAVAMAERLGDAEALVRALSDKAFQLVDPDSTAEHLRTCRQVAALVHELGLRHLEGSPRIGSANWRSATELGELALADEAMEVIVEWVERQRSVQGQWGLALRDCGRAWQRGQLTKVERLAQQALELGRKVNEGTAQMNFGAHMFALQDARGRLAELEETATAFAERFPAMPGFRASLGPIYIAAGRPDAARALFEDFATDEFRAIRRDEAWLPGMWFLTRCCASLADAERAATLYDMLRPYAGRYIPIGGASIVFDSVSRPLGLLAALMGRWDVATGHLDDALAEQDRLDSPVLVCRTQADYARLLLDRARPQDRGRAMELANAAADTAQEIGMQGVLEEALAVKLELQGVSGKSDRQASIDLVAATVQLEQPDLKPHAAPDGTVTILFSDIEGFTAMTERLGDFKMQDVLHEHNRIVREQVHAHGGYEVKSEGDGFMLAFGSARKAIDCAVAMQRAFATHNAQNGGDQPTAGHDPLHVRMGLHTGEVIKEADDFFGKNVILAARIAGQAQGGEILVSSLVKNLTESAGDLAFAESRKAALKGLTGEFSLHPIRWA